MPETGTENRSDTAPEGSGFGTALCAVDGKPGGFDAIPQAAALCGPGGHLTLLIVTSFRSSGDVRSARIGPTDAMNISYRAQELAEQAGVSATVEVEPAAPPARVVLEWAADHDLLALGAPGGSWLGGLLITGVGDAAVRSFTTPLLAVRENAGGPQGLFDHVLVASDGLRDSELPVQLAAGIARAHGSRLTLLHALGHARRAARERVERQAAELAADGQAPPEVLINHGRAQHVLPTAIDELSPSLVVLGSRRRGGLRAIGSVSGHLVHSAPCSVLLVPPA
jgi:nucleotide-binding universal stress UspA family protein